MLSNPKTVISIVVDVARAIAVAMIEGALAFAQALVEQLFPNQDKEPSQ